MSAAGGARGRVAAVRVDDDAAPLDEPLVEAFRAGSLTLGWDPDAERVLVEARAQDEDGEAIDPDEDDDEDEDGPDLLRVRLTASAARSFVARAARVVASGRPPCPLCGAPLDPRGHICPRRNGHVRQLAGATGSACRIAPRRLEVLRDGVDRRSSGASSARATTRCW